MTGNLFLEAFQYEETGNRHEDVRVPTLDLLLELWMLIGGAFYYLTEFN